MLPKSAIKVCLFSSQTKHLEGNGRLNLQKIYSQNTVFRTKDKQQLALVFLPENMMRKKLFDFFDNNYVG